MGGSHVNLEEHLGHNILPKEFNGSLPKYDAAYFTQAMYEAIENNYPPFRSGSLIDDFEPGKSKPHLHKRHSSLLTFPTSPPECKLEKSLSLHNLDDEFHDAISFTPAI